MELWFLVAIGAVLLVAFAIDFTTEWRHRIPLTRSTAAHRLGSDEQRTEGTLTVDCSDGEELEIEFLARWKIADAARADDRLLDPATTVKGLAMMELLRFAEKRMAQELLGMGMALAEEVAPALSRRLADWGVALLRLDVRDVRPPEAPVIETEAVH